MIVVINCKITEEHGSRLSQIKNNFIMGLADVELQQDIMVVDNLTLDTAVKMAVAKETAKRSVDTLKTAST